MQGLIEAFTQFLVASLCLHKPSSLQNYVDKMIRRESSLENLFVLLD